MSCKTKIKKLKIALVLDEEARCKLREMLAGNCDTLYLDEVCFEHLCIEKMKNDCLKIGDIELKHGKIECLKMEVIDPSCC
ncbi:hypothetical protein CIG75_07940 [Tumebacillus algifaecis]|uniref:Uncharacterized protein n=1 Tax=Tumebacillus algifaecis TaxID=1214604 RepID=A0A223CZL8_9BACL|nr:hypothetical protein [Tumebacillus algifaecis]ASS74919.1 hypothetical protein CIG75_07940 [Tumebacillus algifaecis]